MTKEFPTHPRSTLQRYQTPLWRFLDDLFNVVRRQAIDRSSVVSRNVSLSLVVAWGGLKLMKLGQGSSERAAATTSYQHVIIHVTLHS